MCCGSSRAVGLRPNTAFLIGSDDGQAPRYVKFNDGDLVPNVPAGANRYVRGSGVDQAIEEGKIEDAGSSSVMSRQQGDVTLFVVTDKDGNVKKFLSYTVARQVAVRDGGAISVTVGKADEADG